MSRLRSRAPDMAFERDATRRGTLVAGMDEVGKGAWAGPLTVAVVVAGEGRLTGVRDSKALSPERRAALVPRIAEWATAFGIGEATPEECDRLGMSEAQRRAAQRALAGLPVSPDTILVDGKWDFVGGAKTLVGGEQRSLSIAAASVLAKEHRDGRMRAMADAVPWYDFASNKGYPSPSHRAALHMVGPSTVHRVSWGWVDDLPWEWESSAAQPVLPGLG
ncbi:MAG: ribonuclease HII [Acidimicrobiia bacterium]|nr:ribonuclease HII [Acidimicrobiia bacterium]